MNTQRACDYEIEFIFIQKKNPYPIVYHWRQRSSASNLFRPIPSLLMFDKLLLFSFRFSLTTIMNKNIVSRVKSNRLLVKRTKKLVKKKMKYKQKSKVDLLQTFSFHFLLLSRHKCMQESEHEAIGVVSNQLSLHGITFMLSSTSEFLLFNSV